MNTKKLSVALLIALVGFPQISETIYTPALPNVANGLHTTASLVESTLSIYFLGFALGVFIWGAISDRWGRRGAMLSGLVVYGLATLGCASVTTVEALLAWRFLQAFGASVGSVITQTILRDAYDGQARMKFFAVMSGALAFSPAIGPLLGGFISEYAGWRANFEVLTVLSVVLLSWSYFSLPETRPAECKQVGFAQLKELAREMLVSSKLWGHILLIGATNGILFGFYQEAPFVFIEQWGMLPSHYGLFGLLIAGATVLSARISYRLSHRVSSDSFIRAGALAVFGGGLLFSLTPFVVLPLFCIFTGIGLIIPNSLSQALKPYQRAVGTAGSLFGGCYYVLIALFTWLMSLLHNGTAYPLPFFITVLGGMLLFASRLIASKSENWQLVEQRNHVE